ncbi:hypothetical protein [uncultured Shewanella sp.]|uniref:tetratricopeptide repeat protein n=1 Tax=uncultured Shewanella sp. TaxID=173975 RepID=UPI00261A7554|nr:hypothetical protein [uncultured Shewanella sp.]
MLKKLLSALLISLITISSSFASTTELMQQAENGDKLAAYRLASHYDKQTVDTDNNQKLAVKWFKKSAEAGFETAQMVLAFKYALGNGTEKNMQTAYTWFAVVAETGNETAIAYRNKAALELTPEQISSAEKQARVWIKKLATKK